MAGSTSGGRRHAGSMRGLRALVRMATFGRAITVALADVGGDQLARNTPVLVLCRLALEGPLRPVELQASSGLTSGGMTRQLDRLEAAGLVRRRPGPAGGDRRAALAELTPRGEAVALAMAEGLEARLELVRELARDLEEIADG